MLFGLFGKKKPRVIEKMMDRVIKLTDRKIDALSDMQLEAMQKMLTMMFDTIMKKNLEMMTLFSRDFLKLSDRIRKLEDAQPKDEEDKKES